MTLIDACLCLEGGPDWSVIFDRLKPGSSLVVIDASHRDVCEVEDSGFEIRDTLLWVSANSRTSVLLAMKPKEGTYVENALEYGVSGLNIDGSRIGVESTESTQNPQDSGGSMSGGDWLQGGTTGSSSGRFPSNLILQHTSECVRDGTKKVKGQNPSYASGGKGEGGYKEGWQGRPKGVGIGYASEDGTETIANWNCFPACPVGKLDDQTVDKIHGAGHARTAVRGGEYDASSIDMGNPRQMNRFGDTGGASRFFYNAVSDEDLYIYLARLILPPKRGTPRKILTTLSLESSVTAAGWEEFDLALPTKE